MKGIGEFLDNIPQRDRRLVLSPYVYSMACSLGFNMDNYICNGLIRDEDINEDRTEDFITEGEEHF
jgi:hypothetical protein